MNFCRRFLNRNNDPCGRQFDQTTQSARAVPANIAEGSARYNTSVETEMRLLDVARASLSEVMDDYIFFILDKGCLVWENGDPRAYEIRTIRLDPPSFGQNMLHDVSKHILEQKKKFDPWIENKDMIVSANAIIILCLRVIKMLRNQLEGLLEHFKENGGFTENMTATRIDAKLQKNESEGAPKCKLCGAIMVKRVAKKGQNAGHQFWSCSNYHTTGCKFTLPI